MLSDIYFKSILGMEKMIDLEATGIEVCVSPIGVISKDR
jgi:hypothetical protein